MSTARPQEGLERSDPGHGDGNGAHRPRLLGSRAWTGRVICCRSAWTLQFEQCLK